MRTVSGRVSTVAFACLARQVALGVTAFFLISTVLSCGASRRASSPAAPEAPESPAPAAPVAVNSGPSDAPNASGSLIVPNFSAAASIGAVVDYLASDELKGRETGTEGLEEAALYLESQLREYQIQPYFESFRDTLGNSGETAYNIVGVIPGSDPERSDQLVLLGAHYDHIGIVPLKNGDGIANGANDNASGTATVLELARYFSGVSAPARTLVFAFFSAEERGLLGSKHLAQRLQAAGADIYTVLNFEMTGVPMTGKDYKLYLTGYDKSNLAEVSNRYGGDDLVGYLPQAREYNLFQRSDNYPFYESLGIPAHTYSTFDFTNYAHYHQPGDEPEKMDYQHMADLVNRMIPVVRGIAEAREREIKLR